MSRRLLGGVWIVSGLVTLAWLFPGVPIMLWIYALTNAGSPLWTHPVFDDWLALGLPFLAAWAVATLLLRLPRKR